ncbi:MAG: hypothetical protein LBN05_03395 [Oscillospiraceae bacterium]|jgi:hypothetical protein|nr:hypothetical protein [Oscillospiraceae bacterium]
MIAKLKLDSKNKIVFLDFPTGMIIPKYLYYLCQKILEIDRGIEDWQDWTVRLTDALVSIKSLKDMDEWMHHKK